MGSMTLANFREEAIHDLANRTDLSAGTGLARLDRWINTVYEHVSFPKVHRHQELEETITIPLVEDQFEYSLATSAPYITREITAIRAARYVDSDTDSYTDQRNQLQPRGLAFMNAMTHTASRPSTYAMIRKNLVISPGAGTEHVGNIIVCEVRELPTRLAAVDDTTVLLDWWDEVILVGTVWLAQRRFGDYANAVESQAHYGALINEGLNPEMDGGDEETGWMPNLATERMTPRG